MRIGDGSTRTACRGGRPRRTRSHLVVWCVPITAHSIPARAPDLLATQLNRPHGWSIQANNSVVRWLKLRKPIAWNLAITGNNNHIYGNKIDAAYDLDTPSVFPFNTDGYDISGNNVLVEDSWVFNGDDCIAGEASVGTTPLRTLTSEVNKGNNITFRNSVCIGGHGASVSATTGVSNVLINNITSKNSLYATRFKSSLNSVGNITNASDVLLR